MVEIGERPLMGMEFLYRADESMPQLIVVVVANPVNMLEHIESGSVKWA